MRNIHSNSKKKTTPKKYTIISKPIRLLIQTDDIIATENILIFFTYFHQPRISGKKFHILEALVRVEK